MSWTAISLPLCRLSQATLRDSWLNDMSTVLSALSEQNFGNNTRQVEAAVKKHEAIAADIEARVRYFTLPYIGWSSHWPCITLFCVARIYAHIINILWRINTRWFRPHGRPWPVRSPWRVEGWVHSSVEVHAQGCFIAVAVTIVIAALDGIQSSDLLLHCDLPSGSPIDPSKSVSLCVMFVSAERSVWGVVDYGARTEQRKLSQPR